MATIYIDGKPFEVDPADNLLKAVLGLGVDLPYFCWHPALDSVGACRQCAVKVYRDENDTQGRIVMACMTPAADGTRISVSDEESREFREAIISFMMTNHPHDCPVCEEGGQCHLQDMTVMTGHHKRTYHFTKRTHFNQELGPFIAHEMNRCIACYRCVRYYNDYAGGSDFGVFGSAARVYFGRPEPGVLENEFSGNLTEVCPTGVFTDKTHSESYVRKWDMQFAPSICMGCAVGCNISPGERYGEVRRVENRYHGAINGYFLCDRGRFGYGYVNRSDRPRKPLVREGGVFGTIGVDDAVARVRALIASGIEVFGIGSPRASIEANAALRMLVGADHFSSGMARTDAAATATVLRALRDGPVASAALRDIDAADAVLVLGEDVLATVPRVALAIRQAARGRALDMTRDKKVPEWQAASAADIAQRQLNPVFVATAGPSRVDEVAARSFRLLPDEAAAFGFAIAHALDSTVPAPAGIRSDLAAAATEIAAALRNARRPVVVSGTGSGHVPIVEAAADVAWALRRDNPATRIALAVAEANSLGVALLEAQPLEDLLARVGGRPAVVIVLENELERRVSRGLLDAALTQARLVVIDHQMTGLAARADIVLPSATFAEGDGTVINMEGRAQRFFQNFDPAYYDRTVATVEAWRWLDRLRGGAAAKESLDDIVAECERELPQLAGVASAAPGADFRIRGMRLARAPHRQSGRTAARAAVMVHEPRATQDTDTPFNFSMEGYAGVGAYDRPPELLPFAWSPGWNSPQAWNKFQSEVGGSLRGGDAGALIFKPGDTRREYFAPPQTTPATGLRLVALHEHFGSDELTSRADPIRARRPASYVVLNAADAGLLGLAAGTYARVSWEGGECMAPVRVRVDFPDGAVGLPRGLDGIPSFDAGVACRVTGEG